MRGFVVWLVVMGSLIVLGTAGIAVYFARQELNTLGTIIIVCVAVAFILADVILVVFIIRMISQVQVIHLGPHGAYLRWFAKLVQLRPLDVPRQQVQVTHIPAQVSRKPYIPAREAPKELPEPEDVTPSEELDDEIPSRQNVVQLYEDKYGEALEAWNSGAQTKRKLSRALHIDERHAEVLISRIIQAGRAAQ